MDVATAVSSIFPLIAFLIQLLYVSPSVSSSHQATNIPTRFSARLINSNSHRSPFYNPKLTHSDRVKASVGSSIARQHYFQSSKTKPNDMMNPPLKSHTYEYVLSYSIGIPPVETFAVADTGSSLIWLQCLPCESCFNQTIPIFDPEKSKFYKKISCGDPECSGIPTLKCQDSVCHYGAVYADGSSSEGDFALETLTFRHTEDPNGKIDIWNVIIGCGHKNSNGEETDDFPGVFGLNREALSFMSQLKYGGFSYCLIPRDNVEAENSIHFKYYGNVSGNATAILDEGNYYVNLEGISVGDEMLPLPPGTFNRTQDGIGGLIVDSGSAYTSLDPDSLQMTINATETRMTLEKVDDPLKIFDLCYKAGADEIAAAPTITFHFTGVNLDIGPANAWIKQSDGVYCLAMLSAFGVSVLGNYQQQNINVEYDLQKKLISFQPMDCTKTG